MAQYDSVKVKDQLGRSQDTAIQIKRFTDSIIIEDNTIEISTHTIGSSFIWNHSTNGVWGTSSWGEVGRVLTLQVVASPNKIYREHFRDDNFEDTGVTTADWSDTEGFLKFTAAEIAQSSSVAYNHGTVVAATITTTIDAGLVANLAFQLTADGGANWESVTHATEHSFTNTGTDLRFKITASGTVDVTLVRIDYR